MRTPGGAFESHAGIVAPGARRACLTRFPTLSCVPRTRWARRTGTCATAGPCPPRTAGRASEKAARQRQHDAAHHQKHNDAESDAREQRAPCQRRQAHDRDEELASPRERQQEVQRQPQRCGGQAAGKRRFAQRSAGDDLQHPRRRHAAAVCGERHRKQDVERAGDAAADEQRPLHGSMLHVPVPAPLRSPSSQRGDPHA